MGSGLKILESLQGLLAGSDKELSPSDLVAAQQPDYENRGLGILGNLSKRRAASRVAGNALSTQEATKKMAAEKHASDLAKTQAEISYMGAGSEQRKASASYTTARVGLETKKNELAAETLRIKGLETDADIKEGIKRGDAALQQAEAALHNAETNAKNADTAFDRMTNDKEIAEAKQKLADQTDRWQKARAEALSRAALMQAGAAQVNAGANVTRAGAAVTNAEANRDRVPIYKQQVDQVGEALTQETETPQQGVEFTPEEGGESQTLPLEDIKNLETMFKLLPGAKTAIKEQYGYTPGFLGTGLGGDKPEAKVVTIPKKKIVTKRKTPKATAPNPSAKVRVRSKVPITRNGKTYPAGTVGEVTPPFDTTTYEAVTK